MIKPIKNNILVEPMDFEIGSEAGIIVPDSFKERGSKAKVIAVGAGSKNRPMEIPPNVFCWHIKGAGTPIQHNDKTYYLINDIDILGYLPQNN